MCGRIVDFLTAEQIADAYSVVGNVRLGLERRPNYNLTPTQDVPAVRIDAAGRRELASLRWGLIPFWSREGPSGKPLINARAETVASKPAFRNALAKGRCLISVSGFYEWQARDHGPKQPFFICIPGEIMTFAGLWESWRGGRADAIESAAMVTTEANTEMATIHNRMPVVLCGAEVQQAWLDASRPVEEALKLLVPLRPGLLALRPVSPLVNSVRNNGPALLEERRIEDLPPPLKLRRSTPDANEAQDLQADLF